MDLTRKDVISSCDVPEMITQQNLWNSLEISIYSLYLIWNMEMLAVKMSVLWPSIGRRFGGVSSGSGRHSDSDCMRVVAELGKAVCEAGGQARGSRWLRDRCSVNGGAGRTARGAWAGKRRRKKEREMVVVWRREDDLILKRLVQRGARRNGGNSVT
jgi:hypothetical protein